MPASDDSRVLRNVPGVLNDPLCATGAGMGTNQPHSPPPEEPMELTTVAEPQIPVDDPLNFRDVGSGVKESEKEALKTVRDMLAISPSHVEAPQPAPPRSLNRLQHLWGFISPECYDLI